MTAPPVLLAIDAGTSSCRVSGLALDGTVVCEYAQPTRPSLGPGGAAEQELEPIWNAVVSGLRHAARTLPRGSARAIGVTAQLGLVLLDRDDRPLGPAMTWMDHRAEAEALSVADDLGIGWINTTAGRRPAGEYVGPKLLWLRRHAPERWQATARWLTLKDFLVRRLGGEYVVDRTHASYTLLLDTATGAWSDPLLRAFGVPESSLPELRDGTECAGTLAAEVARAVGLPAGIPIAVGGPDGTVGAVGAGMVRAGVTVDVAGTSDVVFTSSGRPVVDPRGRVVVNCHAIPGLWAVGGPTGMTGGCLAWFSTLVGEAGGAGLERLLAEAEQVPAGADGVLAFPNLGGARTPVWLPDLRGAFVGLAPHHTRAHLARAILESVSYQVAQLLDAAAAVGVTSEEVRLVGGGARGALTAQMRADVLELPVLIPRAAEASSLGAALLAGVASRVFATPEEGAARLVAIEARYAPVPDRAPAYRAARSGFATLTDALHSLASTTRGAG